MTPTEKILNTARSTFNIDGEKFWELNEEYGRRLLNAMTPVEKNARLPPFAGRGGFVDTNVREAFKRIGAQQDGARSWGVFSYKGRYFLTRLAHHPWTTREVDGKVVRVPGSYVGVEAYEIPAQLGNRVMPPLSSTGQAAKRAIIGAPFGRLDDSAFRLINGLSMTEMLAIFDELADSDLRTVARNLEIFLDRYNTARIRFALDVIRFRAVPANPPADVRQTGQETEAREYLRVRIGSPRINEF